MKKLNNFKRLPDGCRIVKQSPYAGQKQCNGTYSLLSPNGTLISLYCGNNKREARKKGLSILNGMLDRIDAIWEVWMMLLLKKKQNYYILNKKKIKWTMNSVYTDWKGNKIKAGQTLVFITTEPPFLERKTVFFNPKEKTYRQIGDTIYPSNYGWRVVSKYTVWENEKGNIYYTIKGNDFDVSFMLESLIWQNNYIVCIEGVSDNEKEYLDF